MTDRNTSRLVILSLTMRLHDRTELQTASALQSRRTTDVLSKSEVSLGASINGNRARIITASVLDHAGKC